MQNLDAESDRYLQARTEGNFEIAAVIAGESAALVKEVLPAAAIVKNVAAQAKALLG